MISEIYCNLKDNYRNEYFYKNTLLNKLLLGVHSVNTTTALTEVSIAKSKADFVLINGILVLRILKKRMKLKKEEFVRIPYELKFLVYFMGLSYDDYRKPEVFLERKYGGA